MPEPHRASILVAENDVLIRNLICLSLNNDGHSVLAAANAAEAMELSRTFSGAIGLVITKYADVAESMARERPETRVILLSPAVSAELQATVRSVHPVAFQGPALPPELWNCIRQALGEA